MLKIVSWNIQQGGGSRTLKIISYLLNSHAEIIVLNEYKHNDNGIKIRTALLRAGYLHQASSHAPSGDNGVLLASKHKFSSTLFHKIDPKYDHCVVKGSFDAFDIYGVYLPHKKKHILFDFFLENLGETPSIITGDYNTGKNYIDQKGNSFWYTDELEKLETQHNYIDAFRKKNGAVKEYSWYSHQGNGYRYDHYYIHPSLEPILSNCYYDHKAREEKLSDHAPMFMELG
jgi:exonuclease III